MMRQWYMPFDGVFVFTSIPKSNRARFAEYPECSGKFGSQQSAILMVRVVDIEIKDFEQFRKSLTSII